MARPKRFEFLTPEFVVCWLAKGEELGVGKRC